MTDESRGCPRTDELAAALALGMLTGAERAEGLDHLAKCATCRAATDDLAEVSDRLLLLAPAQHPPDDLERRVVGTVSLHRYSRSRRRVLAAAAALVLVASGSFVGLIVSQRDAGTTSLTARMRTPAGRDVGRVIVLAGQPAWVLVSVPGWKRWDAPADRATAYVLRIELTGARTVTVDGVRPDGDGNWATAAAVDPGAVRAVSVTDSAGHVWCRGQFV